MQCNNNTEYVPKEIDKISHISGPIKLLPEFGGQRETILGFPRGNEITGSLNTTAGKSELKIDRH